GSANDAKHADLYTMLNKQSSRGQNGSGVTDGKSHSPLLTRMENMHIQISHQNSLWLICALWWSGILQQNFTVVDYSAETRKLSYQTGVRVVVAYGGVSITQQ
ncbi:hypothetical protein ACJX0J_038048, partial [Zea mays]